MKEQQTESTRTPAETRGIDRRSLLLGLGAAAAVAYTGAATAGMNEHEHEGEHVHDHSKHSAQMPDLLDATNDCLDKGQRCIAHCLVTFQEGDTSLAKCAAKVHEMHAVCNAFSYLLSSNSAYLGDYHGICAKVCQDCADICREHDRHHECRACAEACEDVVKLIGMRFS